MTTPQHYKGKTRVYPGPNPGAAALPPDLRIVDGIQGLDFTPAALFLGARDQTTGDAYDPDTTSWWLAEVSGLHKNGIYQRFLTIMGGQQLAVPVYAFDDVRVRVLGSSTPGPVPYVTATERYPTTIDTRWGPRLATTVQAGTYQVPPGAVRMYPAQADAGFAWVMPGTGGVVTVPLAVAAGDDLRVMGQRYTCTAQFAAVWEIQL